MASICAVASAIDEPAWAARSLHTIVLMCPSEFQLARRFNMSECLHLVVKRCELRGVGAALFGKLLRGWSISTYGINPSKLGLRRNPPYVFICVHLI